MDIGKEEKPFTVVPARDPFEVETPRPARREVDVPDPAIAPEKSPVEVPS